MFVLIRPIFRKCFALCGSVPKISTRFSRKSSPPGWFCALSIYYKVYPRYSVRHVDSLMVIFINTVNLITASPGSRWETLWAGSCICGYH